jgi:hypothetical protein
MDLVLSVQKNRWPQRFFNFGWGPVDRPDCSYPGKSRPGKNKNRPDENPACLNPDTLKSQGKIARIICAEA